MRSIRRFAAAVLGLCLIASFGANAEGTGQDLAEIRAQQTEYLADAKAGEGLFEVFSDVERRELVERQTRLLALIEGKDNVLDLDDAGQVEAFNLLEQINASVTNAKGQQMVCENVRKTGSNRKTKVCMTVSQREEMRDDSRRMLERANRGYCPSGNCTGG